MNTPQRLVQYVRDGLVEQEHYGFVVLADRHGVIKKTGEDNDEPFYLRSCAKPLQASLIIDYGLDKHYNLSGEEIALCCASHAGEEIHVNIAKELLAKTGLAPDRLKCGLHKPISKREKEKLIISNGCENVFQNNCVGKHIMMLALCKMNGWDLDGYYEAQHPLQRAIKNKIGQLCGAGEDYPLTKDGCGVPIMSMPLGNMLAGYLNLFCGRKYEKIKNAFLEFPYVIGGEDRLDTRITEQGGRAARALIAKVGAGGLCIVVNLAKEQAFVVKISDADMKAREIAVIDILKSLGWTDIPVEHAIKTLHGDTVGEIRTLLQF